MSTLCLCTSISASNPLRTVYTCITQVALCQQHPCPGSTGRWFHQFLVIYHLLGQGGGGGGMSCPRAKRWLITSLPHPHHFRTAIRHRDAQYTSIRRKRPPKPDDAPEPGPALGRVGQGTGGWGIRTWDLPSSPMGRSGGPPPPPPNAPPTLVPRGSAGRQGGQRQPAAEARLRRTLRSGPGHHVGVGGEREAVAVVGVREGEGLRGGPGPPKEDGAGLRAADGPAEHGAHAGARALPPAQLQEQPRASDDDGPVCVLPRPRRVHQRPPERGRGRVPDPRRPHLRREGLPARRLLLVRGPQDRQHRQSGRRGPGDPGVRRRRGGPVDARQHQPPLRPVRRLVRRGRGTMSAAEMPPAEAKCHMSRDYLSP